METSFADDVVATIPRLTVFARRLAKDRALADDLVQEAILRALTHDQQFAPGTNLIAWLATILRNCYFNELRRNKRVTSADSFDGLPTPYIDCPQEARLYVRDFERQFGSLPAPQREALLMVGLNGYSYEDAAHIAGCAVGTMKSRVSRARTAMEFEPPAKARKQRDFDRLKRAA